MLGVIRLEKGDATAATELILTALDQVDWQVSTMRHNLGLALSSMLATEEHTTSRLPAPVVGTEAGKRESAMTVSVVLPVYNHERYIAAAIESVLAQDRPPLELIVIDDGSSDHSVDAARDALRHADIPCRFIARENRGADATLNEAIRLAAGTHIQPLNSDDLLPPSRLSKLSAAVTATGAELAFAAVECIDANGVRLDEFDDPRVFMSSCNQAGIAGCESVGLSFIACNPAVSTGNFFFTRSLFDRLNGFRDLRYHHDWDFILRALWVCEPVFVPEVLYRYRFHGRNTISEAGDARQNEVDAMMRAFLHDALTRTPEHPLAPCLTNWGNRLFELVLGNGLSHLLPRTTLIELYKKMANRDLREVSSSASAAQ